MPNTQPEVQLSPKGIPLPSLISIASIALSAVFGFGAARLQQGQNISDIQNLKTENATLREDARRTNDQINEVRRESMTKEQAATFLLLIQQIDKNMEGIKKEQEHMRENK